MTDRRPCRRIFAALLIIAIASAATYAAGDFLAEPSWQPVAPEAVRIRLDEYLQTAQVPLERQAMVLDAWRASGEDAEVDTLDRLAECLAKADERVAELIRLCGSPRKEGQQLPEFAWLADSDTPALVRHNMRIYLARWLVQQGFYDDAVSWMNGLRTDDVVAPDALLFYRAVAHHQLVDPTQADTALAQLMQRQDGLPTRYQKLADLMQHDLSGLEDDSLDHILRRMNDVRRRLAKGRTGEQRVQVVEKGVIDSLDKLIKKLEEEAAKKAQQCNSSGQAQPSSPMQDSKIAELKGPGKVDRKDVGHKSGWGNLNEKDREKAMQEIGREFPSHYREVIEEYFRRLAAEESSEKP